MTTVYDQLAMPEDALGSCRNPYVSRRLYGCYVTSAAMLLTDFGHPILPQDLDNLWTARGWYVNGCDASDGDVPLTEPSVSLAGRWDYSAVAADLSRLPDGDPSAKAILQCDGIFLGLGYPTHYVYYAGGQVVVANPWHGVLESWTPEYAARAITAVILYRKAGRPPPPPPPPGTFRVTAAAGGAHVRELPGTDEPVVQQPGPNPDVVDAGTPLDCDAWCVHEPRGGSDVLLYDTAFTPPRADKRWFRIASTRHWGASVGLDYASGADPPAGLLIADPRGEPPPPPPPEPPQPDVPVLEVPALLSAMVPWETAHTYAGPSDYAALAALGFGAVLIRAANGDGTGARDPDFEASWQARAPAAHGAGLTPVAWTYWYGPHEGVAGDVAAYLMACAEHTAGLLLDTPAWVVDAEDRDMPGLAPALLHLSARSGKPVLLCFPGDPQTYGLAWDWAALWGACAGYVPMVYTGAWGASPTFDDAMAQLAALHSNRPCLPALDETDPTRIRAAVLKVKAAGLTGASWWCVSNAPGQARAYADAWAEGPPPPPPPAPPPPVDQDVATVRQALADASAAFDRLHPRA